VNRRQFISLLGTSAATWSFDVRAQQSLKKTWRVGVVHTRDDQTDRRNGALEETLAKLGYVQGREVEISVRTVVPTPKNFEDAITGMLPYVDILVVWSTLGAVAARNVRTMVPTVFLSVGAPVNIGIVQSLARPGGNMTGVTFEAATETYGKRLQILKEIAPGLSRVAILQGAGDANVPYAMSALEQAAPALGVKLLPMNIKSVDDLEATFLGMRREQAEALIVVAGALTFTGTKQIANLALQHKLPSCHAFKEAVAAGGLVSLGPDSIAMARQGATYIDRIIQGTEPADLPVEQPARYELHVNLSAAKALGITVPPSLLVRADEVIE